VDKKQNTLG